MKNLELFSPKIDDYKVSLIKFVFDFLTIDLTINTCFFFRISVEIGDNVIIFYEKSFENFVVLSDTQVWHFVHLDSLKNCNFSKGKIASTLYLLFNIIF